MGRVLEESANASWGWECDTRKTRNLSLSMLGNKNSRNIYTTCRPFTIFLGPELSSLGPFIGDWEPNSGRRLRAQGDNR